jgi:hypothetical protein
VVTFWARALAEVATNATAAQAMTRIVSHLKYHFSL